MLDRLDLDRIFNAAKRHGYIACDLYSEVSTHSLVLVHGKIEEVRLYQTGGISMRLFDGKRVRQLSTPSPSTAELLKALGESGDEIVAGAPRNMPGQELTSCPEKFALISQIGRSLSVDPALAGAPTLRYEDRLKQFQVADSRGTFASGSEESASVDLHWLALRDGSRRPFKSSRHRSSIKKLIAELKGTNPFPTEMKSSLGKSVPWPAPLGEVPVRWSARAFSKLSLQFLRAFEGDRFLGSSSFLTEIEPPFPLRFTIEDSLSSQGECFDHEGSPRRAVTLIHEGKPKGLACNRYIAEQLSVPSTGHCRRESYQTAPTVGFWTPKIQGAAQVESPLKAMKWGLSVHDLDILSFDQATADITLRTGDTYLVHQGEEGELVETITLRTNLIKLLQSAAVFSAQTQAVGFPIQKQGQQFLTEVDSPEVLSDPLEIPGAVPPSHYW